MLIVLRALNEPLAEAGGTPVFIVPRALNEPLAEAGGTPVSIVPRALNEFSLYIEVAPASRKLANGDRALLDGTCRGEARWAVGNGDRALVDGTCRGEARWAMGIFGYLGKGGGFGRVERSALGRSRFGCSFALIALAGPSGA